MLTTFLIAASLLAAQPEAKPADAKPAAAAKVDKDLPWADPSKLKKGDKVRLHCRWVPEEIVDDTTMIVTCLGYKQPLEPGPVNVDTTFMGHRVSPPLRLVVSGIVTGDVQDKSESDHIITATVAAPQDVIGEKGKHIRAVHLVDCAIFILPAAPPSKPSIPPTPPAVTRNGPNKAK